MTDDLKPTSMDIHDAAKYLGLSADTLYRYAAEGKVPAFKFGNRWRFRKQLLDKWMDDSSMNNLATGKVRLALDELASAIESGAVDGVLYRVGKIMEEAGA